MGIVLKAKLVWGQSSAVAGQFANWMKVLASARRKRNSRQDVASQTPIVKAECALKECVSHSQASLSVNVGLMTSAGRGKSVLARLLAVLVMSLSSVTWRRFQGNVKGKLFQSAARLTRTAPDSNVFKECARAHLLRGYAGAIPTVQTAKLARERRCAHVRHHVPRTRPQSTMYKVNVWPPR